VDVTVLNHGRLLGDKLRDAATRGRPYAVVLLDHSLPDATTADLLRIIRLDPDLSGTYVVLMSAFDFDPTFEGSKAIKPDVCIAKPVGQTLLRSALQESRQPREPETTAVAARLTVREAENTTGLPALGLDVLVADDNAINREVALAMLERVGCRVTLVEDGGAAVNKAHTRRFDAILMDCQMPGMDGYTATAAIRREETERGRTPTCIVALTANVLARDRSRALEAGMNHFLGKPFTNAQLLAILKPIAESQGTLVAPPAPAAEDDMLQIPADFAAPPPAPAPVTRPPVEADDEPILSDTVVLDMLEVPVVDSDPVNEIPTLDPVQIDAIRSLGRPQVFERLCELLYTTAPDTLGKLGAALEQGDLEAFGAAAHSLKSPVSNLGGRRLAAQLERCEVAAREQCDIKAARKAARGLKQTYSELEEALRAETRRATGT
jgi:CheY-like chemotaxis protein/HPt (histidine-containing phosphotransfer) domain-containing protein